MSLFAVYSFSFDPAADLTHHDRFQHLAVSAIALNDAVALVGWVPRDQHLGGSPSAPKIQSSRTGTAAPSWRQRHYRVRLNSANHQWGKDPPKEVVG